MKNSNKILEFTHFQFLYNSKAKQT
uniref:Uncharacterized protein n=1 Tax=Rhizophora mucronata TaxID=61149 RepID=A0A2P2QDX8_RHIMU